MKSIKRNVLILFYFVICSLCGCQPKQILSAKVYMQQERWGNAIEQLEEAVEVYPNDPEPYYLLGKIYHEQRDYTKMNIMFDKSLGISSQFTSEINLIRGYHSTYSSHVEGTGEKTSQISKKYIHEAELTDSKIGEYDNQLTELSEQIVKNMVSINKTKIAVIEFSDLNGNITELGQYISEELITRLFMTKKFDVIERQLLSKLLEENKLTLSGLIDETTAKQIGKILGVDAICSGTITDLGNTVKINARLISTETGALFAVASVAIIKDKSIVNLMNNNRTRVSNNNTIFFKEDFSQYKEGDVPYGWLGTEHVIVKHEFKKNVLRSFEAGPMIFQIPDIEFPDNFRIKWIVKDNATGEYSGLHEPDNLFIEIGNLKAGARRVRGRGYAFINDTDEKISIQKDVPIVIELDKSDDVFKLTIDGSELVVVRYPNFKHQNSLILNLDNGKAPLGGRYQNEVDLLSIEGIKK